MKLRKNKIIRGLVSFYLLGSGVFFILSRTSFRGKDYKIYASEVKTQPQVESSKERVETKIFPVRYFNIDKARKKVEGLISKEEDIGAYVSSFFITQNKERLNFLIVKDRISQLELIKKVIEELDKQAAPVKVTLNFKNTPLGDVLNTLSKLTDLNIVGAEGLSKPVTIYLSDVPLENALDSILQASGYTYIKEGKILRIVPISGGPEETRVFELQYISAEQVKEAIEKMFPGKGRIETFSEFKGREYSNILVVKGSADFIKEVDKLIKKLDKEIPQVMIEVKFVDVTLSKSNEIGINWDLVASFTGSSIDTTFPFYKTGKRAFERPTITEPEGEIQMGTISFSDFKAALSLVDTESKTRVISNPRIATRDGVEAELVVGNKIPIATYQFDTDTGLPTITGYQEVQIGVVLRVTPFINKDGTVTMKIHPEISEIVGYTGYQNERPIISTREITTTFTVESAKTVVLGGLMRRGYTESSDKIPFLGDLPLVGRVFSKVKKEISSESPNRELVVFITPYIIGEKTIANYSSESKEVLKGE